MRIVPALALALLACAAVPSDAAAPRGVTFTDPTGDANGLDGANGQGSQANFDIVRVWLGPYQPTRTSSGILIRLDLASAPSTAPGTSFVFTAVQYGCDITATTSIGADGSSYSSIKTCSTAGGSFDGGTENSALRVAGNSLFFAIPAGTLSNAKPGSTLSGISVSTAIGDPVAGVAAPAKVDTARYPKSYRLGS